MLSEIMSWYKKKKRNLMLFKVDFEKAFDTVSWKFLDHMLSSLGFGNKWHRWINVCLHSARASVLINGSPTSEFSIKRGLRQGDPLSPFLFIIVMEGLHIALKNAVSSGLIQGASIGESGYNISHLFYADDVVIISDWNRQDMINIIHVLHVFYLASSLKINVSKSNVYGLGVNPHDIKDMARDTRCGAVTLASFIWGSSGEKKRCRGSNGIIWRLVNNPDSIWARVIVAIHGVEAGVDLKGCSCKGVWASIILTYSKLHNSNILPIYALSRKVRNGFSIRFWKDHWNGNATLMSSFNRLFHLDANEDFLLSDRRINNSWVWNWKRQIEGSRNKAAFVSLVLDLGQI
ncbi:putative RNA-directed DNA polymerase, eukaryota, reverse transcriptase zinc-binding domain protein [Tanacetum coccineum]